MPFEIYEGIPGQGKSLMTAVVTYQLLKRNKRWHEKHSEIPIRCVWTNVKMSQAIEDKYADYLRYWGDASNWEFDIEWIAKNLRNSDLIWDEISAELPANGWNDTSSALRRFLGQWRKRGIDIFANTQDYADVDISARRRVTGVYTLTKFLGSRDISATKPAPKYVWGWVFARRVLNPKELDPLKKETMFLPSRVFSISKRNISLYDTTQDITSSDLPPLKHIERVCLTCGKNHIKHE